MITAMKMIGKAINLKRLICINIDDKQFIGICK